MAGEELDPPEFGKVFISVKPKNGSYLSQITKDGILRQLKQYSIAGIKPELVDLQYLYVEVDSSVYYNANVVADSVGLRTKVINTLNAYAQSADINSFGGRFKYSKVVGLIDDSDKGVTSNITKIRIRRDLIPELNTFATYELCFGNKFHQKRTGYSIKSSGFNIDGVSGTIYIGDVPQTLTRGRLVFFKLENNTPIIVKNNAGIVKYDEGEVLLDVVNITGTDLEFLDSFKSKQFQNLTISLHLKTCIYRLILEIVESAPFRTLLPLVKTLLLHNTLQLPAS